MKTFLALLTNSGPSSPWYDNGWLIGITTGVLSGALLAAATPIFLRRRRARDLAIRRERAAEDVISTLRPSVAAGSLPSPAAVEAIARACAFRRGLDSKNATPTLVLLDVLISEVMASPFLPSDIRLHLSDKLVSLELAFHARSMTIDDTEHPSYKGATILASTLGATTLGAAGAVSAVLKSWVPFVSVAVIALVAFTVWQIGDWSRLRVSGVSFNFSDKLEATKAAATGEPPSTSDSEGSGPA